MLGDDVSGSRAMLGLADLVAVYAEYADEDLDVAKLVAESIGLRYIPPQPDSTAERETEVSGEKPNVSTTFELPRQREVNEQLSLWIPTRFQTIGQRRGESEIDNRPPPAQIRWRNAAVPAPSIRPLAPWAVIGERLRKAFSPAISSRIDVPRLVDLVANGEVVARIPTHKEKRVQKLHIVLDRSKHLTPFFEDQSLVVHQLRNEYAVQTITTDSVSSIVEIDDIIIPHPPENTQILVMSDLGEFVRSSRLKWRWLEWAKAALARECHLVALVPCAEARITSPLCNLFRVVSWQSDSHAQIVDPQARKEVLKRLFVLTAYCRRVEPGLLREMRHLLPDASDASLESDYWNSRVLTTRHPSAAALNQQFAQEILQPEFERIESIELRKDALKSIRQWRTAANPEIWLLEVLSLPRSVRSLLEPNEIEDARECARTLDRLRKSSTSDQAGTLYAFLHRSAAYLTDAAYDDEKVGKLLRSMRFEIRPDLLSIPAGTEPEEVPAGEQLVQCSLRMSNHAITLEVSRAALDLAHAHSIYSSNSVLKLVLSRQWTELDFWKSGTKPDFVSAFGRDEYGAWFEFQVPSRNKHGFVSQRMRWIRPGTFMMGSPEDEPERYSDEVLHQVTLTRGYWLADTACTQALWQAVLGENPSNFKGELRPVEQVSYEDVLSFCTALSQQLPGLLPQLPTEAQWEYACRVGKQMPFSFGESISTEQANFDGNHPYRNAPRGVYRGETVRVQELSANSWGLYQMHGNVWEWCADWYSEGLTDSQIDPVGPRKGSDRVVRGGSWINGARYVRSACRLWVDPGVRDGDLGFRLLSSASAEPSEMAEGPVAEQGSEPARIGAAEEVFREVRVRVEGTQPTQVEIEHATKIRVVSNLEVVELQQLNKPEWAVEFGRDVYGVYGDFEVESTKDRSMVQQRLRWIPPGSFQMGSPPDEPGRYENETLHPVTISTGFWMFDAPCSQKLWTAIMDENPSYFADPDRPVESVDWDQVKEFAQRLSELLKYPTFTLPTEAQWEYACRAGTSTAIYSGPLEILGDANAPAFDPIAWYGGNSGHKYDLDKSHGVSSHSWLSDKQYPFTNAGTRKIKQKAPNPWGLYDMLGNVWEWCADWYAENAVDVTIDPTGPESGSFRVMRGGSWINNARGVRSACRGWGDPGSRGSSLGFRLLSSASPGPVAERVSGSRRVPRDEAGENQRTK